MTDIHKHYEPRAEFYDCKVSKTFPVKSFYSKNDSVFKFQFRCRAPFVSNLIQQLSSIKAR